MVRFIDLSVLILMSRGSTLKRMKLQHKMNCAKSIFRLIYCRIYKHFLLCLCQQPIICTLCEKIAKIRWALVT